MGVYRSGTANAIQDEATMVRHMYDSSKANQNSQAETFARQTLLAIIADGVPFLGAAAISGRDWKNDTLDSIVQAAISLLFLRASQADDISQEYGEQGRLALVRETGAIRDAIVSVAHGENVK
jgi:hypothetical protein